MCVFFRNNHFSTLYKCNGTLYQLATDLGFKDAQEIVWEQLENIDGDNLYCNDRFVCMVGSQERNTENVEGHRDQEEIDAAMASEMQQNEDRDFALAMSFQEEEQAREERRIRDEYMQHQAWGNQSKPRPAMADGSIKKKKKNCIIW